MSSDYITRIKTFDGEKQIDYNSLANLPDIPQGTSELINDAGFLTHIPSPTNATLGGIKAQPRGHEDNAEVKVGADGKLYVNVLSKELDVQSKRVDSILALKDGSTTGDAELIDIRLGYDGTEYTSAGEAVRNQVKGVPNYGVIVGNYIKFYRSSGSDEPDFFLFEVDVTQLLESGLSLENLSLSAENENNSIILSMDDGKIEKVVELPIVVDSALSLSSINPVQNRVVTEQLNYVIEEIENIKENGIGGGEGVTLRLTNQNGTSTLVGSYGSAISLMFTFTSTENDIPTGNANLKITINGIQKVNMSIPQGLTSIDVAPYLNIGNNTVIVTCTDIYGKSRSLAYDVTVIQLSIESTFNPTVAYNSDILFKYKPYGSVEKTIHFVVDGAEIGTVITSLSGKDMSRTIPKMSHGAHKLEVYSTATLNDVELISPKLVYDIICIEDGDTTPIIASVYEVGTVSQGEQISIPYIVYDPTRLACDITLTIYTMESGNEVVYNTQNISVDRSKKEWNTRKYPIGEVYFRISYGDIAPKIHKINITESKIKIEIETNDLELHLSSEGRSNDETNPNQWTHGDVITTFNNMNWNSVGWVADDQGDTCLRLNGDATAEIQFKPFAEDLRVYGKTLELEFTIRDVNNREAIPISCMSGDIGFEVTADTARIRSEQSEVFCNYKAEEKVHLAFVIESKDEYQMLSVFLNGVMSDAIQYPGTDNFQQLNPVNISIGSPYCGIDLYAVRSYATALSDYTLTTNYIADITDIVRKTEAFEDNDIYDEFGQISFTKAKEKNSIMIIVGDLPTYKGDKKTCKIYYYDVEDSNLNFEESLVGIDVQGTSSQFYNRKNWKLKCVEEHYIDIDQLPGKVICIKVDYAEATGTHNTQNAVFVEKLYSEKIPPQEDNPKVRTTIYGKPILLFHQEAEGMEPVFYGKANFNWDKGAENVFGFTSDYDVECWEFKNNTSEACLFTGEIPVKWSEDFEARYPDGYGNISRFKVMHDWVVSTKQDAATGNALASTYTDVDGNTYTHDTAEYRLAKFKTEFEDYFNMHYALIYYVYTFFALMVDQRAKNMFLTYWGNTRQWYFYFYDNDTAFGINNEGGLVFDYYMEDSDQVDGANVYNGQLSTLWVNFKQAFPDLIQETYQDLRSNSVLNYDELIDQFITHGSDKWSESIYNEDGDFKYISMLRTENDATNLPQIRGTGEEHLRYFIENRLNYCDSKWYAGSYPEDNAVVRIYTPVDTNGAPLTNLTIPANANITVTPYSAMYAGVRYKANGTLMQERLEANETYTFVAPNETFNDTETAIYGASQLSSLGDLAPLYLGYIDVGAATKLVELKIGDGTEGYKNANLYHLAVGTNRLLKKIDIQNCDSPRFVQALVLSGCPNIEEVYAKGSSITGVELPDSGYLKILQLPATITNLTLKNQPYIEDLTIEGYENLKTITIENCPVIDSLDILDKAVNVERVRLTNVDWHYDDVSLLYELIDRDIAGIDENGVNTDTMWIDGKCHIETLTGNEFAEIKSLYPYLDITYTTLISKLTYMSEDGQTELHRETIYNGGNGTDPVANGTIETPTKESTAQYHFTYSGWSTTLGGDAIPNALLKVEGDRIVYAAYTKEIRIYTVNFYNGSTLLETDIVEYDKDAVYNGTTPIKEGYTTNEFEFIGWKPEPTNIQGDTDCYAQYFDKREIADDWSVIADNCLRGSAYTSKYEIGAFKPLVLAKTHLPFDFHYGSAVVYNNEIHILGGDGNNTAHYKCVEDEWVEVSILPYAFYHGDAVVYNNEIHILGGNANHDKHYKWDGYEWIQDATIPRAFYNGGKACIYNNEIHIFGGQGQGTKHHKFDGSAWSEVSTLPSTFQSGKVLVYKGEIHAFGGPNIKTHYKYDGSAWSEVSTLPYPFWNSDAVVYNDKIHLLGGQNNELQHRTFNGIAWENSGNMPYKSRHSRAVICNNEIHILGSNYVDFCRSHYYYNGVEWNVYGEHEIINMEVVAKEHDEISKNYKWIGANKFNSYLGTGLAVVYDGKIHHFTQARHSTFEEDGTITNLDDMPFTISVNHSVAAVWNNEIHIINGVSAHYKYNGTEWSQVCVPTFESGNNGYGSCMTVYNDELYRIGGNASGKKLYKFNGTEWIQVCETPIISYQSKMISYNNELHIFIDNGHYTYNGSEITKVGTLPYNFANGSCVVYMDEIHFFGGSGNNTAHYKYNGLDWESVDKLPTTHAGVNASVSVVFNEQIYLVSNDVSGGNYFTWKWELATFEKVIGYGTGNNNYVVYNDIIYGLKNYELRVVDGDGILERITTTSSKPICQYQKAFVFKDELYMISSESITSQGYLFKFDDLNNVWTDISAIPSFAIYNGANYCHPVVYNNHVYFFDNNSKKYVVYDGETWSETIELPYNYYSKHMYCVHDDKLYTVLGNNYDLLYAFDGTDWVYICTAPTSFKDYKIFSLNGELNAISGNADRFSWYKFDGIEFVYVDTNIKPITLNTQQTFVYHNHIYTTINGGKDLVRLENPRAPLTFIARQACSETQLFNNDNNSPHWSTSTLRTWCNGNLFNSLPDSLQSAIRTVNKVSDTGYSGQSLEDVEDRIWIPSVEELGLESDIMILGQGEPYPVFTDDASRQKVRVNTDDIVAYHTRSSVSNSSSKIFYINAAGKTSSANASSSSNNVVFGFCV